MINPHGSFVTMWHCLPYSLEFVMIEVSSEQIYVNDRMRLLTHESREMSLAATSPFHQS